MRTSADASAPPSHELLLFEVRAIWELGAFFTSYPLLRLGPRDDGHPVLVLVPATSFFGALRQRIPAGPGARCAGPPAVGRAVGKVALRID